MKSKTKSILLVVIIALIVISGILGIYFGVQQSIVSGSNQMIALPHFASFRCDKVGSASPTYVIPTSGFWISKNYIGATTDQVTSINVIFNQNFWSSLVGNIRIRYHSCDFNQANCGSDVIITQQNIGSNTYSVSIPSVDILHSSKWIIVERAGIDTLLKWIPVSNAQISYSYDKYGLRLYSTTRDPAGAVVCSTGCDLTCPDQAYRAKLVYTNKDVLLPDETVPYLEYWESINYDLNEQGGASVYSSSTNQFCLAGRIYSAGTLTMESGTVYTYPQTFIRTQQCCPGAVISTSTEDKVCQSDGTWKVIVTPPSCISDTQCPGQGSYTCQNKKLSSYKCVSGSCVKQNSVSVECCFSSECLDGTCQLSTHTCVGGNVIPPVNPQCVKDTECLANQKCINNYCTNSSECRSKFLGLVPGNYVTVSGCYGGVFDKALCELRLKAKQSQGKCVYDWTFVWIIALVFVIIAVVVILLFAKPKRKKKRK